MTVITISQNNEKPPNANINLPIISKSLLHNTIDNRPNATEINISIKDIIIESNANFFIIVMN